jgi:hypothetical protein
VNKRERLLNPTEIAFVEITDSYPVFTKLFFNIYFLVTLIRRSRPATTTKIITTTSLEILFADESASLIAPKTAALVGDNRRQSK